MAPLSSSLKATPKSVTLTEATYTCTLDPEWTVGTNLSGGYILALCLTAGMEWMKDGPHKDPQHLTGNFLKPLSLTGKENSKEKSIEIRLKMIGNSKSFSFVRGGFFKNEVLLVQVNLVFTLLPSPPFPFSSPPQPPLPTFCPQIPLKLKPSQVTSTISHPAYNFRRRITFLDLEGELENINDVEKGTNNIVVSSGTTKDRGVEDSLSKGTEMGMYVRLEGGEKIRSNELPIICDLTYNTPVKLVPTLQPSWFATISFSLEFKYPLGSLPPSSLVGVYSYGRMINRGIHDQTVEVWSDPTLSLGKDEEGWRNNSVCLGIAHQLALTVPLPKGTIDPVKWNEERKRREKNKKETSKL